MVSPWLYFSRLWFLHSDDLIAIEDAKWIKGLLELIEIVSKALLDFGDEDILFS